MLVRGEEEGVSGLGGGNEISVRRGWGWGGQMGRRGGLRYGELVGG